MNAEQSIRLCTIAFYICIGVMAAGFGFAMFAFFKHRIPHVFSIMTGRAKKKKMCCSAGCDPSSEQETMLIKERIYENE